MNQKRFAVLLFGAAVALVIGFLAINFIAAFTVAIFLYYSTRGYYKFLAKLRLPTRIRAVIVLASLVVRSCSSSATRLRYSSSRPAS